MSYRSFFCSIATLIILASVTFTVAQPARAQITVNPAKPAPTPAKDLPFDHPNSNERINLGPNVNSGYSELFPIMTPDEMILFFSRKGAAENVGFAKNPNDEDIWYSLKQPDGNWSPAQPLPGPLNTNNYDGVRAINATGSHLYLQNIYRADGTGTKGFSISIKQPDGSYAFPEPLEIEDYYNDTTIAMISVSQDEKHIVLAVMRKDGQGAHDLYVSNWLGGNKWSQPVPIVTLNTPGDEVSPFIAYDDHTLYFATNGRGGFGLHDIFVTRRLDESWLKWSTPMNLGEPINTPSFDAYFMVTGKGDTAYFSSAHESSIRGQGKSDIWKIGLKARQRPGFDLPTAFIPGNYSDEEMGGAFFRLDNVLFDVGKSSIRDISKLTLDTVATIMTNYGHLRIEVQGHTDATGDAAKNLKLSQDRANAVRTYLMQKGIASDRVEAVGYGQTRPIAPNTTPLGRQLNRRVVIQAKGELR